MTAERLLNGIVPLAAAGIAAAAWTGVRTADAERLLLLISGAEVLVAALAFLAAYLLGALVDRLAWLVVAPAARIARMSAHGQRALDPPINDGYRDAILNVLQYGSTALVSRLELHESQLRLFRNTAINVWILVGSLLLYRFKLGSAAPTGFLVGSTVAALVVSFLLVVAFVRQRRIVMREWTRAAAMLDDGRADGSGGRRLP